MLRVWVWEMLVLTWSLQFAYLQISTVICALIRRLELRIEGEFPKSDYSVRSLPPSLSSVRIRSADALSIPLQSMMVQPMPCQILYRRRHFD